MRLVSNLAFALGVLVVGGVLILRASRRDDDTARWLGLAATVVPVAGVAIAGTLVFGDRVTPGCLLAEVAVAATVVLLTWRLGLRRRV